MTRDVMYTDATSVDMFMTSQTWAKWQRHGSFSLFCFSFFNTKQNKEEKGETIPKYVDN